jgi:hypothetical protein
MLRTLQTNFTGGVVSSDAKERLDIAVWKNSVQQAINVRIHPQGGCDRRPGLAYVDNAAGNGWSTNNSYQIEPFIFSSGQQYVFVFGPGFLNIYYKDSRAILQRIATPWPNAVIAANQLSIVQSFDTMVVFHKDYPTQKIVRGPTGFFGLSQLIYSEFNNGTSQVQRPPFHKYAQGHVAMWTDGPTNNPDVGYLNVFTSDPVFEAGHLNTWLNLKGVQLYITAVIDPQRVLAVATSEIAEWPTHTIEWQEQAFSPVRGWAACGVRHEQRLWQAGGRDLPNTIFGSTTYDPFNFYLGTAQATDAINYTADADHVAEIRRMVSYGHLQIFTADGEFFAPTPDSGALTPGNMSVRQASPYGIADSPAIRFDQSTIFLSRAAGAIREFVYNGIDANYSADSLTFMAGDLLAGPIDLDAAMETSFAQEALGIVTNSDGSLALISKVRKENVGAWMRWTTEGFIRRVGVVQREIWAIVDRNTGQYGMQRGLEVFDPNFRLDFAWRRTSPTPVTTAGLAFQAGMTVHMRSGDLYLGTCFATQPNGAISWGTPVQDLEAGLNFPVVVQPMVQEVPLPDGLSWGQPKRIVSTTISVRGTLSARIDDCIMPVGNFQHDPGIAPERYSGKFKAWRLGWGTEEAPYIWSDYPLPFYLRAISMEVEV